MVSIVTKGRSFAGMMNWLNARMSANQGCNTAKGVLFAAPFFKYIMDGEVLLQYRERAEPFAAMHHARTVIKGDLELQYRERAEPFAARVAVSGAATAIECCNTAEGQNPLRHYKPKMVAPLIELLQYRKRAEPFAAFFPAVCRPLTYLCCNTAKGQNPLRRLPLLRP